MIASFAMVSMSTFEVMATLQDPKVAAKFVLFVVVTFVQLSYWCLAGTLVYSQVGRRVLQVMFICLSFSCSPRRLLRLPLQSTIGISDPLPYNATSCS